jgi:hypothetical protein
VFPAHSSNVGGRRKRLASRKTRESVAATRRATGGEPAGSEFVFAGPQATEPGCGSACANWTAAFRMSDDDYRRPLGRCSSKKSTGCVRQPMPTNPVTRRQNTSIMRADSARAPRRSRRDRWAKRKSTAVLHEAICV